MSWIKFLRESEINKFDLNYYAKKHQTHYKKNPQIIQQKSNFSIKTIELSKYADWVTDFGPINGKLWYLLNKVCLPFKEIIAINDGPILGYSYNFHACIMVRIYFFMLL